uniref:Uncharacterized protein n=1 Tax=viral metagenome TaxID=1070528 RepID=A0A6C0D797_9ZZZZ
MTFLKQMYNQKINPKRNKSKKLVTLKFVM